MVKKTLSFIGCGKLGQTLGYLWAQSGEFALHQVLTSSPESAALACDTMQGGTALASFDELSPADIFLICTQDVRISDCCHKLSTTNVLSESSIVFHCSGSLSSAELASAKDQGAEIASAHPAKSFANVRSSIESFKGTAVTLEGDAAACRVIQNAFEAIGGESFQIDTEKKPLYHAATVFASNHLVSILEMALRTCQGAGLSERQSQEILRPLVLGTTQNFFALGSVSALTGPIARGDVSTVEHHLTALKSLSPAYTGAYQALGSVAVELAAQKAQASEESLDAIEKLLREGC